ncbi:oxygen-insensitive NADPH nitroreductase [Gracilibacillus salinarum]|uniref:Oxygen-insensitive NADPH nitroreductase n=1 Tax=Gracilibacillus salinarum TaxID=2932255 RepID=A0ABY4GJX7_9BACI|nr:oxygen-insensitive NADPH nitroreductase [Gracilibacillus salinarum]UOQ84498.1 oxygen-insensitive NADPH nitroreductase [Gracilibacillus salinarum]
MSEAEGVRALLKSHRSIRRFTDQSISQEIIDDIVECGQWAPTSHNVQAYSVICVRDKIKKQALARLCGNQRYIEECPVFFIFVADFFRHAQLCEANGTPFEVEETENLLVGAVDTALFAENVLLAARSYGLGGVMIGGIRNDAAQVAKLVNLPKWTVPIMGMCLGYPAQEPWQKPRIARAAIYHEDTYQIEQLPQQLQDYDTVSADYYRKRTNGHRTNGWSAGMTSYFGEIRRANLTDFIKSQGFSLK